MAGNIGSTATILFIVVAFLVGLNLIGGDLSSNTNLDANSVRLLSNISSEYNSNYAYDSIYSTATDNLTSNSTFDSVDPFSRQYLEDKSDIQQKQNTLNKILNVPSLFLLMLGIENSLILIAWNTLIYGLLTFMLALQIYKAVRTGEVD